MEEVILVDRSDQQIGTAEKLSVHQTGQLHRAVSVFIFHSDGRMLLQKRAKEKYHSSELWSNACCSHPRPSESTHDSAIRRLYEEMHLSTQLTWLMSYQYQVKFENGLIEHEIDHIFVGTTDNLPVLNESEVSEFKYVAVEELINDVKCFPNNYTYWFKELLEPVLKSLN